jgi:RNA polymerase sigma-70 factor (ECF subfamily)
MELSDQSSEDGDASGTETVTGDAETLHAVTDFDRFYRDHHQAVVGLAVSLSGNRWAAEELAQDAFVSAYQQWDRIGGYDNPGAWVRRVVANRSVSRVRRLSSEAKALVRLAAQRVHTVPPLARDDEEFWREVRRLPRQQAQVVALHYLEDLPVADIATILGVADGTVKSSLHRGRKNLADRLRLSLDPDTHEPEPDDTDEEVDR